MVQHLKMDWKKLDTILQFGPTLDTCSEVLGVSPDTIERRIKKRFDMSFGQYRLQKMGPAKLRLLQLAFEKVERGDTRLLIYMLEKFAAWESQNVSQLEDNNNTITLKYNLDYQGSNNGKNEIDS